MEDCTPYEFGTFEYRECQAGNGSKAFQFQLGMEMYVIGEFDTARKLFEQSAERISPTMSIYQPPIGNESYGTIHRFDNPNAHPGNNAARYMLSRMYTLGQGVTVNERRAERYREDAGGVLVRVMEKEDHFEITYGQDPNNITSIRGLDGKELEDEQRRRVLEQMLALGIMETGRFLIQKRTGDEI